MDKISKHFVLEEFFEKDLVHSQVGDRLLSYLDPRILDICDFLRERYGPATVNNWHLGGELEQCGFRRPSSKVGASCSQHKFGRAADLHFAGITAHEIRTDMKLDQAPFMRAGITAIEEGVTWLHVDCRWIPGNFGILFFHG